MRSRLRIEIITSDAARKATYRKRKGGIMKKLNEFTTLCGVEACTIISSPCDPRPDLWPNPLGVHHGVSQYRAMPIQKKKMLNQESFIKHRIAKVNQELERLRKMNGEKETYLIMLDRMAGMGLQNLSRVDMNDTAWQIENNLVDIHKKMEAMDNKQVYRPELPPLTEASDHLQQVNDQSPEDGEHRWWRNNYMALEKMISCI